MATPKNKKAYRYGAKKRICFKPAGAERTGEPSICFTGRERVPTGAGAPEHGGTACRTAGGKFKRCAGGPRKPARQGALFGRRAVGAQVRRPTKAALDAAVKAMRLYLGGQGGYVSARDYDKLYSRAVKAVEKIANTTGLSYQGAWSQIEDKAHAEGRLRPQPGKDY